MTMSIEDAGKIERPPIEIGRRYTFYATAQEEYRPPAERLRNYTGKLVTVKKWENEQEWRAERADLTAWLAANPGKTEEDYEPEIDPTYTVEAHDGRTFSAFSGELDGWFCDTGQFFWPDATYGHDHDPFALANERDNNTKQEG